MGREAVGSSSSNTTTTSSEESQKSQFAWPLLFVFHLLAQQKLLCSSLCSVALYFSLSLSPSPLSVSCCFCSPTVDGVFSGCHLSLVLPLIVDCCFYTFCYSHLLLITLFNLICSYCAFRFLLLLFGGRLKTTTFQTPGSLLFSLALLSTLLPVLLHFTSLLLYCCCGGCFFFFSCGAQHALSCVRLSLCLSLLFGVQFCTLISCFFPLALQVRFLFSLFF